MDAAPALKKSVESSIWLTLLRMLFHTAWRDTINRQHPRVWNHPKMDNQGRIYPHLLSKALLLLGELHSSVAPGAEVLRRRNHLPVFKLQILHQQLERWWNYGNEKIKKRHKFTWNLHDLDHKKQCGGDLTWILNEFWASWADLTIRSKHFSDVRKETNLRSIADINMQQFG